MSYKTYKKQRCLFFWLSLLSYFLPYVIAVSCLLPYMRAAEGVKWGIGLAVLALNSLPFLGGIFRGFRAHFPFVNTLAIVFVMLAGFFTLEIFSDYVYTFMTIESIAAAGSLLACLFWHFHKKYKRRAQTVATVVKSGLLEANK